MYIHVYTFEFLEALSYGLLNEVVPEEDIEATVRFSSFLHFFRPSNGPLRFFDHKLDFANFQKFVFV